MKLPSLPASSPCIGRLGVDTGCISNASMRSLSPFDKDRSPQKILADADPNKEWRCFELKINKGNKTNSIQWKDNTGQHFGLISQAGRASL